MLTSLGAAAIALFVVAISSAFLLRRDVALARLRERVAAVRAPGDEQALATPLQAVSILLAGQRGVQAERFMRLLRLNPDIPQQNIVPWKLVLTAAILIACAGFFYGREFLGWELAALMTPVEAVLIARFIFGWQRARYQKALLEQIPDVMALICRGVGAGIPLSEALRSVALDADTPSREEFVQVINEVAIGQPLEDALWKLHERVGLPEYAFFAVTIGLQAQTGGNLVETLENLQDTVRRRVALSRRGKALAAEARMSAIILGVLPFVAFLALSFIQDGFATFFVSTPGGHHLLLMACGFLAVGMLVMRQLIRRSLAP